MLPLQKILPGVRGILYILHLATVFPAFPCRGFSMAQKGRHSRPCFQWILSHPLRRVAAPSPELSPDSPIRISARWTAEYPASETRFESSAAVLAPLHLVALAPCAPATAPSMRCDRYFVLPECAAHPPAPATSSDPPAVPPPPPPAPAKSYPPDSPAPAQYPRTPATSRGSDSPPCECPRLRSSPVLRAHRVPPSAAASRVPRVPSFRPPEWCRPPRTDLPSRCKIP